MAIDLRSTWRPARVITNRPVANGSMWIALAATDEGPAAFHPGHVLGLGMKLDDHTLIRHAYTVSRGEPTARRFEHLYRVVSGGRMSPLLAQLSPADTVYFHGPFHTPIQQEIDADARHILSDIDRCGYRSPLRICREGADRWRSATNDPLCWIPRRISYVPEAGTKRAGNSSSELQLAVHAHTPLENLERTHRSRHRGYSRSNRSKRPEELPLSFSR